MRLPLREGSQRKIQAALIANVGQRSFDAGPEVAAVAVRRANALGVFFQLACVVGAGKQVFQDDRVRNADRPQVLHGGTQRPAGNVLVAVKLDIAHFDRGAFLDVEVDRDRRRRNGLDVGMDGRKLVAVLGQQFLQHGFASLILVGRTGFRPTTAPSPS